jgi:cell division protein FtsB
MKRPHRSIETFDISLMAVVTKAMGAFLVLMLLLMPYYSSSPLGKDEAQDLANKVQEADARIKGVLDKLGDKELGKDLTVAREQLGTGTQLIAQMKRYVDQLSAQVKRLEDKIATLSAELDRLKQDNTRLTDRVAALEKENADLKAENETLKAEIDKLKGRVAELEKQLDDLNKQVAQMSRSTPEQVAELKKRIAELEQENAQLKQDNAALKQRTAELEKDVTRLQASVAALERENAALKAQVTTLQKEKAELEAKVAELVRDNLQLKAAMAEANARLAQIESKSVTMSADGRSVDCTGETFIVGAIAQGAAVADQKYLLNSASTIGNYANWMLGRNYGSSLLVSRAPPQRYYFYLLFQRPEQGPLVVPAQACSAVVVLKVESSQRINMKTYTVAYNTSSPISYFADVVIENDGRIHFEPTSDAGKAYLDDQLAHAKIEAAGAAPPPVQTQPEQRAPEGK